MPTTPVPHAFATKALGAVLALALAAAACSSTPQAPAMHRDTRGVTRAPFGTLADGTAIEVFTFANAAGVEVRAITYGGIIVSLRVPDRSGRLDDVVLGHDGLEAYVTDNSPYLGALIGRYGNRIAKARFTLEGR
ncbi:MAG: hypothetical protein MUF60_07695, partial [Vicinamibacterales bacterium]|nr:hypothetical protein [Vicinamibacterales bacterium]